MCGCNPQTVFQKNDLEGFFLKQTLMAKNVFTTSPLFANEESKAKFMDYLTSRICQLHDIPDLASLDYGKHILGNKILPQLHAKLIQIPINVCFRGSLQSFSQQQLKQEGISISLGEILQTLISPGQTVETSKATELFNYNLERAMLLGLEIRQAKNECPVHVGIRTNAAQLSNLVKDSLVERFLESAYNVILAPYETKIYDKPLQFLSDHEFEKRVQAFHKFGSFSSLDDLLQGAICIPRNPLNNVTGNPDDIGKHNVIGQDSLTDELLLLPTLSLLVDYAEIMCSEEYPVFQLKTDPDKPSIYSLLPTQGALALGNNQNVFAIELADYSKSLVDLSQIKFSLFPIDKLSDTSNKRTFNEIYHALKSLTLVDSPTAIGDEDHLALNTERSINFEFNLVVMALPKQLSKNIFSDAPTLSNAPIFLPSEDIVIKDNMYIQENINQEDVEMTDA